VVRFDATTLWHFDAAEWGAVHSIKCEKLALEHYEPGFPSLPTSSGHRSRS